MIKSTDVEGRLRLFRYGLIVIVVVTFLVSLLSPYVITSAYATELRTVAEGVPEITIATFLVNALITTVIVGVLLGVVYFIYRSYLKRSA